MGLHTDAGYASNPEPRPQQRLAVYATYEVEDLNIADRMGFVDVTDQYYHTISVSLALDLYGDDHDIIACHVTQPSAPRPAQLLTELEPQAREFILRPEQWEKLCTWVNENHPLLDRETQAASYYIHEH